MPPGLMANLLITNGLKNHLSGLMRWNKKTPHKQTKSPNLNDLFLRQMELQP
jgi:hypothetical protein